MKSILLILLLLKMEVTSSQTCEKFNRNFFHGLPKEIPELINCKDSNGNKQGWWIKYSMSYNSEYKPDYLDTGEYVSSYSYGQYKNNLKNGEWIKVNNVHIVYVERIDNYYYGKDTAIIKSEFENGEGDKSEIYYSNDSSIIKSLSITNNGKDTIFIVCKKNNSNHENECRMTYRNELIKVFSQIDFELEFDKTFNHLYEREKLLIRRNGR